MTTELAAAPGRRRRSADLATPDDDLVSLGMLVPAPGTTGGLGVVTVLSPNASQRQRLHAMFDLLADTFTVTWAGEPAAAGRVVGGRTGPRAAR